MLEELVSRSFAIRNAAHLALKSLQVWGASSKADARAKAKAMSQRLKNKGQ